MEAVGLTRFLPLGVNSGSMTLIVDGTRTPDGQGRVSIAETVVDPGYWRVMRTPILLGRAFDERDTATSPRVAVVNETFAAKFWPGENPLGKTVRIPDVPGPNGARQTPCLKSSALRVTASTGSSPSRPSLHLSACHAKPCRLTDNDGAGERVTGSDRVRREGSRHRR